MQITQPTAPISLSTSEESAWREELRNSLRTVDELIAARLIASEERGAYERLLGRYRFSLPRYYANLIDRNDPNCPIRLQAIPSLKELDAHDGMPDPLSDLEHQPASRITHRYPNRALIHLTPSCSMYCRYCFRKSLLNELSAELFEGELHEGIVYLKHHTEIAEVIFSGGDPFLANPGTLETVLMNLKVLTHIERIRFHTRVPVTLPMRVTEEFVRTLRVSEKRSTVVLHFNHPKEITPESILAISRLAKAGLVVLNQSVLLKRVNDDADTLCELSARLFEHGVLPYYLHHPDRARGTSHFQVTPEQGLKIFDEMKRRLPGYLVPRYVIDVVGLPYKEDVATFFRTT